MKMDFELIDVTPRFNLFCIVTIPVCAVKNCSKLDSL
eukprot:XP_001707785.1 Hypothetical protein GL50803_9414 [Giardia lamblia ATCC 50803]